jgi:hypothetical protein
MFYDVFGNYFSNNLPDWLEHLPKSQQSWVQSQHPPTQSNLRGGRYSNVEYGTYISKQIPV